MVTKKAPRKGKLLKLDDQERAKLEELAEDAGLDGNNWLRHIIAVEHKKLGARRGKKR